MKIKFSCNSGANIHSEKSTVIDLKEYLGHDNDEDAEKEWSAMTDEEKYKLAEQWAWNNGLEICYEELNE